jgi:hypothetical protein
MEDQDGNGFKMSVLRIRDVYPGSEFFSPGSRVKTRHLIPNPELKYFLPNKGMQ